MATVEENNELREIREGLDSIAKLLEKALEQLGSLLRTVYRVSDGQ